MTLATEKLHVAIVSWEGMHAPASRIAAALEGVAGRVSVVYSNREGVPETGPGDWIMVPQSDYFGLKFRTLLDRVEPDEAMLLIQADARCDEWAGLARRCHAVLAAQSTIGVWSPSIDGTPFSNNLVATGDSLGPGLIDVWQCDAIVLAMVPRVLDRLRTLDFTMNNLGWGIDWAAILHASDIGLRVVRDLACEITHPPSRGYESDAAAHQMWAFLSQFDPKERALYHDIERRIRLRRAERAEGVHLLLSDAVARRAGGGEDALDLDVLSAAFAAVRLDRGRLTVVASQPETAVELEIGTAGRRRLPVLAGPADFHLLTLDPPATEGVVIEPLTKGDWCCPGQATLRLSFPPGAERARVPLAPLIDLLQDAGALVLSLGLAVHRANADLLVEWWDAEDTDRGAKHFIKFDAAFSGSRALGDYQAVRLAIPDTGSDRHLRLSLCFWSGQGNPTLSSEIFLTHPVLETATGADPVSPTVPLMTCGMLPTQAATALPLGMDIGVVSGPVALYLGDRRFVLLGTPDDAVSLELRDGGLMARSDRPCRVTLVLNGRLTRALWLGPQETALNIAPAFLATPGATVELRTSDGTQRLARCVVAARTDAS